MIERIDMKPTMIHVPATRPSLIHPRNVQLTEDSEYEDDDFWIKIYAGYDGSDGGSLPRFSWSILGVTPTDPRCINAFLNHDFVFQSHLLKFLECNLVLSRILAIPPSCEPIQQDLINWHVWAYGGIPYYTKSNKTISETRKWGEVRRKNKLTGTVIR